jgi:hypothetical protein
MPYRKHNVLIVNWDNDLRYAALLNTSLDEAYINYIKMSYSQHLPGGISTGNESIVIGGLWWRIENGTSRTRRRINYSTETSSSSNKTKEIFHILNV